MRETHRTLRIGAEKFADNSGEAALNGRQVFFTREIALIHSFRESVHKHARGGGLVVVAVARSLIEHLPPQTGVAILPANNAVGDAPQDLVQFFNVGMRGWNEVERIDQRHGIPTFGAAPKTR